MIPIRDINSNNDVSVLNWILIWLNVIAYLIQLSQGHWLDRFIYIYGLVPASFFSNITVYFSEWSRLISFFSFMFLHGSWIHLLGNMWFLYIFGAKVETYLGVLRYLIFYFACGILSGVSHVLVNFYSNIPVIGASGAVAGVMGAYFVLYPKSKVLILIPVIFFPWFVEIPAFFFVVVWLVIQIFHAVFDYGCFGGTAWWSHIGGFIFGILILNFFNSFFEVRFDKRRFFCNNE